ncbi:Putative SOS response-associated peptidase YedK [Halalkaliarchaeum sp. AArc-CO]|uniref:SOS response-associated peptidase n=1 Tax=Halalkaliarchaeum sp. AArc-CO TaxID=2866381 RepID=UPI00217E938B|nr:SOS response-associated peptidase [Halalkaliarchaeum sp. AArc-CO]UWG50752.1 Putative SOS response-associated peptidase YedK [Halalkaliarchaeum sp. AArc-CO]
MCGRNSLFVPREQLEARFDAELVADGGYEPRYNVAPGDGLEVITAEAPDEIDRYRWGIVPPWSDDSGRGDLLVNACSETVAEKRVFRDAWKSRPCLVLSSGFYEWQSKAGGSKRPYRIYQDGDDAFAMAGLWENPDGNGDETGESMPRVTILTTEANQLMEPIHDRMPVVLPNEVESEWLEAGPTARAELCRPYPGDDLDAYEISTRVNDPGNDDERVIEPLEHEQSGLGEFS